MTTGRIFGAEFAGTFLLVLGGAGTAVFSGGSVGPLGVALAFGLSLMVAMYTVGPVSGCHVNPAVSLGMVLMRRIDAGLLWLYWAAQLLGAVFAGLVMLLIARGSLGGFDATPENFSANLWGLENNFYTFGAMLIAEVVLTAVLVFVVISSSDRGTSPLIGGVTIGMTYTLIHLISLPIDNTSVNPARSFGTALFAGGDAITQLWAFFVFPMIGALLGVIVWIMIDDDSIEDTLLEETPLDEIRDSIESALD